MVIVFGMLAADERMPTSRHSSNRHGSTHASTLRPIRAAKDTHRHGTALRGTSVYLDFKGVGRSAIQSFLLVIGHISSAIFLGRITA